MHIAESRIVNLAADIGSISNVVVTIEHVTVSRDTARKLAIGDKVSLVMAGPGGDSRPVEPPWREIGLANQTAAEADAYNLRARSVAIAHDRFGNRVSEVPEVPEAPAFQPVAGYERDGYVDAHEIGIAYYKGLTYQYAYPKGAQPADACRWSHIDETEVREELWDIQPGDIVYDIGSAFGSYALSALAAGAAHVVCFNPNPQEQELLLASARLNGWGDKVTRHNVGLWSESGYLNDEEQTFTKASGDFKVTKTADGRHTQLFAVQTLDSMPFVDDVRASRAAIHNAGRSVAKLDVEGAECEVLKGARVFFAQREPAFVLIEVHVFKDASLEQQTDAAMADLGYVPVTKRPYHSVMHALYRMKGWDD